MEMVTDGFGSLLDGVLRDVANPEMPEGFAARVLARASEEHMTMSARVVKMPTFAMDRAGWQRGRGSVGTAMVLHAAAMVLVALLVRQQVRFAAPAQTDMVTTLDMPAPPWVLPKAQLIGGGGGQRGPTPVTRGHLPRLAEVQVTPPTVRAVDEPKLPVEPVIVIQQNLSLASALPDVGVPNSPLVGAFSGGNGFGGGLGSGNGNGLGPGSGGNMGGGAYRIGGGVSAPVLVYQVEPEFSEEARKAKLSGNVLVNLWVDAEGRPSHVRVLRGIGMGLDERALAAVKQYRFKPAMLAGKPVTVEMNVEVDFQIF